MGEEADADPFQHHLAGGFGRHIRHRLGARRDPRYAGVGRLPPAHEQQWGGLIGHILLCHALLLGQRVAVPADVAFVEGDLRDADAVARLFAEHKGFDGIMHFASFTLAGESMQQPLKYLRDNLLAGANLLEQAVAHDVGRFILSSTANLFDDPAILIASADKIRAELAGSRATPR
jgi:nucleoside-diphosphate-sugar epimerase